jgi:uncharacterized damage-inducible protein DinB
MKKANYLMITGATVLLITMASFVTGTKSEPEPMVRTNELVADWERAKEYTKEYLDVMPEEGIHFKATPEIRSFAEQMLHLAMGNAGIVATSTGKERLFKENIEKSDAYKTKEALTKVVMQSYDFVIATLKELDDKKLQEKVTFFNGQEYSREVGIGKAFEHQTHHRGQATIYLRLKGITPPNEKLF